MCSNTLRVPAFVWGCFHSAFISHYSLRKNYNTSHLYVKYNFLIIFPKLILRTWISFSPFQFNNTLKSHQLSSDQAGFQKAKASGLEPLASSSHLTPAMYASCPSLFPYKIIFKQHMALTMRECPGRFSLKGLQSICQAISHFLHALPLMSNQTLLTAN